MGKENIKPIELELLAPAKDLSTGKMAVLAGADAVFIGGPVFGARAAASNSWEDIEELVKFAHQYYVKVYLPINTIFFDDEAAAVKDAIWKAHEIGVDAIIIQDMGIMEMDLPAIPIFASTQTHNYDVDQVKFLEMAGFSRVILARELSLEQIKKIRNNTLVDLETFVHGALCVSFSGRCYMSQALCGRSANRGKCVQACRLPYSLADSEGKVLAQDKYLLSLKDLNLINSLPDLVGAGVTSFKIEGRLKNEVYVGNVVAKYRQELDKIIADRAGKYKKQSSGKIELDFDPDLDKTFNRGYTDYFFRERKQEIVSQDSQKSLGKPMGKVSNIGGDYFVLDGANDIKNGDGVCWFNEKNELVGVNINVARDGRIYPAKWQPIKVGTEIYRNLDPDFEKKVLSGATRRVVVDFFFKESADGFNVKAIDEDGNTVEKEFVSKKDPAKKPEIAETSWKQQFSKLGDTIFEARNFSFNFSQPYFVPLSVLNDWRRDSVAELYNERMKNYPRISVEHKKTEHHYPHLDLDYSFNIANSLAREFYKRHGARVTELAFEQLSDTKGKKVMTCKHCLKYFLGACPNNPCGNKPEFTEPLYLVREGKKFKLTFDCANCVMEIWN
jgi:putative protease